MLKPSNIGSQLRSLVDLVQARLNGSPDTANEWHTIALQLQCAAEKAKVIERLAEDMERGETNIVRTLQETDTFTP